MKNMKSRLAVLACAAAGAISLSSVSSAGQPTLKGMATQLKQACQSDIDRYCSDVTPGEGRIASCLNARQDKLSDGCRKSWSGVQANLSKRMDRAEVAFRKQCGKDVQKFCSDVPAGKGRLLDCLGQNEEKLSSSCSQFRDKLDSKLAEIVG